MRPTLVMVNGLPGSGKTTLASALAAHLELPHLSRDRVRGGMWLSAGGWTTSPGPVPTSARAVEVFFDAVATLLDGGVSMIVDQLFASDDVGRLDRWTSRATCRVVHTVARMATDRHIARLRTDGWTRQPALISQLGFASVDDVLADRRRAAEALPAVIARPANHGLATIVVDTTDGYDPALAEIAAFVTG